MDRGGLIQNKLSHSWFLIGQLRYANSRVPGSTLCGCSTVNEYDKNENHHWLGGTAGIRRYINPNAKAKLFLDGKVGMEYFLARVGHKRASSHTDWHAYGYNRFVPTVSTSLGLKFNRITLTIDYNRDIYRAFTRGIGEYFGIEKNVKTGILRQGLSAKLAYQIF
jgi:hypothetical protein